MKSIKLMILSALAASLLLLTVSCSKTASENAVEKGIASISSEAISEEMIASITAVKTPAIAYFNTENDTPTASESVITSETVDQSAVESMLREAEAAASRAASAAEEARKPSNDAASYYADVATKAPSATGISRLQNPPSIQLQYQFVLRETAIPQEKPLELMCVAYIYAGPYTWTVEDDNGTPIPIESNSIRPCYDEKTSHLKLSEVADSDYIVDLSLSEKRIESYTLMAYPIDGDDYDNGTPCTVRDGKLELFTTPHYYELTVQYTQGTAVYGFFVE